MTSFCATLRTLHVDKSALQLCRRRNHFSQSSCGLREREMRSQCKHLSGPRRGQTLGPSAPKLLTHSLIHESPLSGLSIRCSVLFPCSASSLGDRFHPQRFHSPDRPQKCSSKDRLRGEERKPRLLWYANRGNFSNLLRWLFFAKILDIEHRGLF